jgi:hypothetical protein
MDITISGIRNRMVVQIGANVKEQYAASFATHKRQKDRSFSFKMGAVCAFESWHFISRLHCVKPHDPPHAAEFF